MISNRLFLLLGSFLFLFSCTNPTTKPQVNSTPTPVEAKAIEQAEQAKVIANNDIAHESFLQAQFLKEQGNLILAEPWLRNAAAHAPESRFLAFEHVRVLLELNRTADALQVAQHAIKTITDPNAEELFLLAHLYRQTGQIDSCKVYFQKTIALQPDHFRALYEYSVVLELLQDFEALEQIYGKMLPVLAYPDQLVAKYIEVLKRRKTGGDSLAIAMLFDRLKMRPVLENAEPLFSGLVKMDSLKLAQSVLEILEEDARGNETTLLFLRSSWEQLQNFPGALRSQVEIWKLDTNKVEELKKLIELRFRAAQFDSLQSEMQHYLRLDSSAIAFHMNGILQTQLGKFDLAAQAFNKAIAKAPQQWYHRQALYQVYAQNSQWDKAQKTLESAVIALPGTSPPLVALSAFYFSRGLESRFTDTTLAHQQYLKAIEPIEKAYRLDTNNVDVLFTYAALLERINDTNKSLLFFERLLKLEPNSARILNTYGYILIHRNVNPARGIQMIDAALAQQPTNVAYLDSKAWGFAMNNQWEKARLLFQEIIKSPDAQDTEIFEHAALVEEYFENWKLALEYWNKVLELSPNYLKAKKAIKRIQGLNTLPSATESSK